MTGQDTKTRRRPRWIAWIGIGILVLTVAILAARPSAAPRVQAANSAPLEASGIIEAKEVSIASELGGIVATIPVSEGSNITSGDLLVQLETVVLDAQIEVAEALIAIAEAGLAQVKAGARPGQITTAEAQLAQAKAGRTAAQQAVSDTKALLENPQHIKLEIAIKEAQLRSAEHRMAQSEAYKNAAEIGKGIYEYLQDNAGLQKFSAAGGPLSELPPEIAAQFPVMVDGVYDLGEGMELHIHGDTFDLYQWADVQVPDQVTTLPNDYWQSWVGVNSSRAEAQGIEASLAHLYIMSKDPQELRAAHDGAVHSLAETEALTAQAQAQVDGLKSGASQEQIGVLEARVTQANAVFEALTTQRSMLCLVSPLNGTVTDIVVHEGEIAARGATLLTVADLSNVTLTVYVPENRIGQVLVNQQVQVTVDSFADRVFEARVSHISNRAEYTPRNVATKEERVNLVFAVEIKIGNEDGALKPGMPADALFLD